MDNQYNEYINHDKWSMSNYINSLSGFNNEIHKIQIANKYSEKYYDTIKKNL